jgi:hypothetical protein
MSPKQTLILFKQILKDAADFYDKPLYLVTGHEFSFVSKGRLGAQRIGQLGGFAKLKAYVAPNKHQQLDKNTKQLLEKILNV